MGNTLLTTHKIACGHTDRRHMQQSLLCDRLSQPTAEMVDSLLFLQGQTVRMQQFADRDAGAGAPPLGANGSKPVLMLAMGYCILFGYRCQSRDGRGVEPLQPNDFITAFESALQKPSKFLEDLVTLRAQTIPKEKLRRVASLLEEDEVSPAKFGGPFGDVLQNLAIFLLGAVECAEIYSEIRESAAAGKMDNGQAAKLLDAVESDQKRMIQAMGDMGYRGEDEEEVE